MLFLLLWRVLNMSQFDSFINKSYAKRILCQLAVSVCDIVA